MHAHGNHMRHAEIKSVVQTDYLYAQYLHQKYDRAGKSREMEKIRMEAGSRWISSKPGAVGDISR